MKIIHTKKYVFLKISIFAILMALLNLPSFVYAQTSSSPDIPDIITGSRWGASGSDSAWPIEYNPVEKFVLHHTASSTLTPDPDGSGEYKNMVKSIYNYHKDQKTWYDDDGEYVGFGDIGYNYLIDPNGNIYEGRSGGNGSVGGHVTGFNEGSVGISILGRYQDYIDTKGNAISSHPVTMAIRNSLENLIGWLASSNSVDLNKFSDFKGKMIDGLVGHKDLSATICPGAELYKQLDGIQSDAIAKKTTFDNYAYRIGGDGYIYVIEDGYKKKFNSQSELPSAYKNKAIKPISKSSLDLFRYRNAILYPDGSLLQEFDTTAVYYIDKGNKRHLDMTGQEFIKMGFSVSEIKNVFKSDLKMYADGKSIKYGPEGKLVKGSGNDIYFIENGKKRRFTSAKLFEYLGYKWKNVINDNYTEFYLEDPDMLYPDGSLVKSSSDSSVYLVENGKKRKITSENLFKILGYSAKNVLIIEKNELANFGSGKNLVYPDNTLVRSEESPSIYLIKDGGKKEFTSAVLFERSGYRWRDVISIQKDEMSGYPQNGRVLYSDGSLIKSSDNPNIYLLEAGKKRQVTSSLLFTKLKLKWTDVISIAPDEMKDYPAGESLSYPEGTLIRREGFPTVYKIENGKKKEFISMVLFEKTKNRWSDIATLDKEEFAKYPDGGILKYPENTLLKQQNDDAIYVVKNGKAEWIKTIEDFKNAKYKWSDIIEISRLEMSFYLETPAKGNAVPVVQNPVVQKTTDYAASDNNKNVEIIDTKKSAIDDQSATALNKDMEIRIAIYSTTGDNISIKANGKYTINRYNENGTIEKTETKTANEQTTIGFFDTSSYFKFIPSSNGVIMEILSYSDPSWNQAVNDNKFRGNIEIRYSKISNRLWIINELPLEDYINGIAEASSDSPGEYLKSFGTIARTYAMYYIKKGGKHAGEPFHLKNSRNGNGNDQSYKGYNFELRAANIVSVNKLTAGNIITFDSEPIVAAYSSDSGGTTKNACEVLSKLYCDEKFAYLHGGIEDPIGTKHDPGKVSISHGAGMSAVGAYQMAVNGDDWQKIIQYYYPGVKIEKYY
ncbi:MAG: N-acetylmuramoyl-L-alanine amidase [Minisyncoccia bacterium]